MATSQASTQPAFIATCLEAIDNAKALGELLKLALGERDRSEVLGIGLVLDQLTDELERASLALVDLDMTVSGS